MVFEGAQMVDIADKDFEIAVIMVFRELRETMFKALKESMMTMTYQIENINKEMEINFLKRTTWKS